MKTKAKKPIGTEPEAGKTKGKWAQEIKAAMNKTKPVGGWPEPAGRYGTRKK